MSKSSEPTTAYGVDAAEWPTLLSTFKNQRPDVFTLDQLHDEAATRKWSMDLPPVLLKLDVLVLRKLLSVDVNPPIDEAMASGCVEPLIAIMKDHEDTELVFEASWAISNVASGSQDCTYHVANSGGIEAFVQLFTSTPSHDIFEQACWGLGNIAGEGSRLRDYILETELTEAATERWSTWVARDEASKLSISRNFVWMISNLCRGKPSPKLEKVTKFTPLLNCALTHSDEEVRIDAMWAYSYISDGTTDRIQAVLDKAPMIIQEVKTSFASPYSAMVTPAVRIMGNLVTGNDQQTQRVIDGGLLDDVEHIMSHPKRGIKKEACWALSNIAAGTKQQVMAVMKPSLLAKVFECATSGDMGDTEIKKEAAWILANVCSGGGDDVVDMLLERDVLLVVEELLLCNHPKVMEVTLELMVNILQAFSTFAPRNPIATMIAEERSSLLDVLEDLQSHVNDAVATAAADLIEEYFVDDSVLV